MPSLNIYFPSQSTPPMSQTRRVQSVGHGYEPMMPRSHHGDPHDLESGVKEYHSSPSPVSDYNAPYDAPRRRSRRNSTSPPFRRPHSSSPPRLGGGRHDDHSYEPPTERMPRSKSKGHADAPPLGIHRRGRSLSRPGRRSTDDRHDHHNHRHHYGEPPPQYRSPSSSPERITNRRVSSVHAGRDRRRQSSSERQQQQRHRSHPPPPANRHSDVHPHTGLSPRWQGAAAAAFQAGSLAALAVRSEPGPWRGSKGARVVTAAIGAGMIKAARHQSAEDPQPKGDRDGKGRRAEMKTRGANMVTGAVTGFIAKQFAKDHPR